MNSHPYTEIPLELADADMIRQWAENISEANPISRNSVEKDDWPGYEVHVRKIYMGVELTFMLGERSLHTIALYCGIPSDVELDQYMKDGGF